MDIEMLAVTRGHQRLLNITNQGHLKRYIDLTGLCLIIYIGVWAMGVEVSVAV